MLRHRKPSTCAVCPIETIESLIFKDYSRDFESTVPPKGLGWFCRRHADAAMKLDSPTLAEAITILKRKT